MRNTTIRQLRQSVEAVACPLCKREPVRMVPPHGSLHEYDCALCGEFDITETAEAVLITAAGRVNLSGWIRQLNRLGVIPKVDSRLPELMNRMEVPSIAERLGSLLLEAVHGTTRLDEQVSLSYPRFTAASYSYDHQDFLPFAKRLERNGWVQRLADQGPLVTITLEGHAAAEKLKRNEVEKGPGAHGWTCQNDHCSLRTPMDITIGHSVPACKECGGPLFP